VTDSRISDLKFQIPNRSFILPILSIHVNFFSLMRTRSLTLAVLFYTCVNPRHYTDSPTEVSELRSPARLLLSALLAAAVLVSYSAPAPAQRPTPKTAAKKPERTSLVERVGTTGILQVEAESFRSLSPRQKLLAYYLSQAAIAVDPIIYDQLSRYGLRQKHILESIVSHPRGVPAATLRKIVDYTKLFWANSGNHNGYTAQKFLPDFTPEELERAGLQAIGTIAFPSAGRTLVNNPG